MTAGSARRFIARQLTVAEILELARPEAPAPA
jgi:hypothetical protein